MNAGDTAWVLVASVLVLIMTPGLAFFYGGMARRKNVLSLLMQCFFIMCLIGVQWVLYGYSLAFGPDINGIIGSLDWAGLKNVEAKPFDGYSKNIPHLAFMIFQCMFAVITPALIVGAFAERIKFSAFVLFTLLWATLVYDPIAHWVWGVGGWLRNLGALDFAGGIVVHVSSGISAFVMCLLIGKRIGYTKAAFAPHNLPFTVLGGALLWFGWFGFNAGSALAADGLAANARPLQERFCHNQYGNGGRRADVGDSRMVEARGAYRSRRCIRGRRRSGCDHTRMRLCESPVGHFHRHHRRDGMLCRRHHIKAQARIRRCLGRLRYSLHRRDMGHDCHRALCRGEDQRSWSERGAVWESSAPDGSVDIARHLHALCGRRDLDSLQTGRCLDRHESYRERGKHRTRSDPAQRSCIHRDRIGG